MLLRRTATSSDTFVSPDSQTVWRLLGFWRGPCSVHLGSSLWQICYTERDSVTSTPHSRFCDANLWWKSLPPCHLFPASSSIMTRTGSFSSKSLKSESPWWNTTLHWPCNVCLRCVLEWVCKRCRERYEILWRIIQNSLHVRRQTQFRANSNVLLRRQFARYRIYVYLADFIHFFRSSSKKAGTCITSPFSRFRQNKASARVCTRINLQKRLTMTTEFSQRWNNGKKMQQWIQMFSSKARLKRRIPKLLAVFFGDLSNVVGVSSEKVTKDASSWNILVGVDVGSDYMRVVGDSTDISPPTSSIRSLHRILQYIHLKITILYLNQTIA